MPIAAALALGHQHADATLESTVRVDARDGELFFERAEGAASAA